MPTALPSLRAVVFDLDGTLTDSAAGICDTVATVLAEAGCSPPDPDQVRAMIGLPLVSIFARCLPAADELELEARVERYKHVYAETVIPRTALFPGAWSLLRACREAGLELALVTAKFTPVAEAVLARCRIRRLFRSVVGGNRAARPKPHPDLLQVALDELDLEPAAVLAVGDGDHDILMGRAAGVRTCGVTWGVHSPERLRAAGADFLVDSPAVLRDHLLPTLLTPGARLRGGTAHAGSVS
jgi:2-phosphoglycolate phosphatase